MIILDSSAYLPQFLLDEDSKYSDYVLASAKNMGDTILVPRVFFIEISNALGSAVMRGRILKEYAKKHIENFYYSDFEIDDALDYISVFNLSMQYNLAFYDAIYLELALRKKAKIATLDDRLKTVAKKLKVFYS